MGSLPVVYHIIHQDGMPEEHCLDQRGVGTPGTMAVNVELRIRAQCIEDVEVIERVEQRNIRICGISFFQLGPLFALFPITDKNESHALMCKGFEGDMAIVFGLYAAYRYGITGFFQSVFL